MQGVSLFKKLQHGVLRHCQWAPATVIISSIIPETPPGNICFQCSEDFCGFIEEYKQIFLKSCTTVLVTLVAAGVLVLGATNRPQAVDAALLRPGRFDALLYVPPPDEEGRLAVLKSRLSVRQLGWSELNQYYRPKVPWVLSWQSYASGAEVGKLEHLGCQILTCHLGAPSVEHASSQASHLSPYWRCCAHFLLPCASGAELANLCREAALAAVRENMEDAREVAGECVLMLCAVYVCVNVCAHALNASLLVNVRKCCVFNLEVQFEWTEHMRSVLRGQSCTRWQGNLAAVNASKEMSAHKGSPWRLIGHAHGIICAQQMQKKWESRDQDLGFRIEGLQAQFKSVPEQATKG
eukprot:84802-Pelagomonas_calceolata.AAC.4